MDERLYSSDEADLVVDHSFEAELDIIRQIVETAASCVRPLLGLGAQLVIVAWQHHLDEVGVGHDPVLVGVEKADALGGLTNADRGAIVFQELAQLLRVDGLVRVSVDSAEGGVRGKAWYLAQFLAVPFNHDFALGNGFKYFFEDSQRRQTQCHL